MNLLPSCLLRKAKETRCYEAGLGDDSGELQLLAGEKIERGKERSTPM